jgi:hemolysin activation/secretion protein
MKAWSLRLIAALVAVALAAARLDAQSPSPVLRGLVFVDSPAGVAAAGWPGQIDGVDVSRVPVLAAPAIRANLDALIGQPLNMTTLARVRDLVTAHFVAVGRPFVRVETPPQDATNGIVQVVVTEGRLGALKVDGARYFSERDYLAVIGLQPGDAIDAARLDRAIAWLNTNPYRRVTPVAQAGHEPGTTDLVLQAQEMLPLRVTATAGNTGNPYNGEIQLGTSVEWGNAFGRGDLLNASYTTSQDRAINQFGAGYTLQLPWRDALTITGSYARTRPDPHGSAVSTEGTSSGASLRYVSRPLKFADHFAVGIDYRCTDNDVLFGGASVFATSAVVVQAAVEYATSRAWRLGVTNAAVSGFFSPGGVGAENTNETFESQRQGASARYGYARLMLGHAGQLRWGLTWSARATGQLASARLLSTEQLGFGGDNSVRGFHNFATSRDEGLVVNGELHLPQLRGMVMGTRNDERADVLSAFVFADYGTGRQHGEDAGPLTLVSVGPGLRYYAGRFATVQLSYGHVLRRRGLSEARDYRLHFQLQAGF